MTDVPYRDLGSGFVRLGGSEVQRRLGSALRTAEDVLAALLDNSVRAGARNIYVASSLRARRFRTLTVIDDGIGVPESHASVVFDPGVTTESSGSSAGMSLHHIRAIAVEAELFRPKDPTSFSVTLDTGTVPEKTIQTRSCDGQPVSSNLLATALDTATGQSPPNVYYSSPSGILSILSKSHIIQQSDRGLSASRLAEWGREVGIEVSSRTAKRILLGDIEVPEPLGATLTEDREFLQRRKSRGERDSRVSLSLDEREKAAIADILQSAAKKAYLSVGEIEVRSAAGEMTLHVRLFESEDEYG